MFKVGDNIVKEMKVAARKESMRRKQTLSTAINDQFNDMHWKHVEDEEADINEEEAMGNPQEIE